VLYWYLPRCLMGKLNFRGYLISRFYPTREVHENLMHAKNMFYSNLLHFLCITLAMNTAPPTHVIINSWNEYATVSSTHNLQWLTSIQVYTRNAFNIHDINIWSTVVTRTILSNSLKFKTVKLILLGNRQIANDMNSIAVDGIIVTSW